MKTVTSKASVIQALDQARVFIDVPERFAKLLGTDQALAELWRSRKPDLEFNKKLLSHLLNHHYVFTRHDLMAILSMQDGHLEQLLKDIPYRPLECSTGEDLEQAIESTTFIVKGWLPRGHVTANVSSPGLGKSYVALDVTRIIITGQPGWFDGVTPVNTRTRKVIWCEAEGFQAGLNDRIKQLGIPPGSIIFPFKDPLVDFKLERHLADLERAITYHEPDLVVIDSLRGSHGREEDDSTHMQKIMSMVVSLAKRFNIAVLVNHHANKPAPGQPDVVDIHRVRGSGAIAANSRMIWGLEKPNPDEETVRLKAVKSNLCPFPNPMGFIVTDAGIVWTKAPMTVEESKREVVRETKEDEAAEWLKGYLKHGPKPQDEVIDKAEEAGIRYATLRRASERPNFIQKLRPDKDHKHWRWALSDAQSSPSKNDEQVNIYEQVDNSEQAEHV